MIYFLYGEDTYRSRRKLEEIMGRYKEVHKSGLNLRFFDGTAFDFRDFLQELQTRSIFQEKKMLILKNIFKNQPFKDVFLENGEKLADSNDITVIWEEMEISPQDNFLKFLAKNSKAQEFKLLEGKKLSDWAEEEFKKYDVEIQPEALRQLVSHTGNDLWRLSNEIQKLAAFRRNKAIELKDINLLVKPEIETDIFKTIEALAARNKKTALSLVHEHLEKGDNPLYLLSMISFQFRNLLVIKKTGKLGGHPYFVRKTAGLASHFTFDELKKIYSRIFETDLKIKTGQLDPQTGLDLLVAEI